MRESGLEQFERTKRYLKRIEDIYAGVPYPSGGDKGAYDDDVVSFFIHCYHVRDWVIRLNKLGVTASQVDAYMNSHQALRVCADLANGSKHCRLTWSLRTGCQPHIAGKIRHTTTLLSGDREQVIMWCKYSVVSDAGLTDALELATECVRAWDVFLTDLQAKYQQSKAVDKL